MLFARRAARSIPPLLLIALALEGRAEGQAQPQPQPQPQGPLDRFEPPPASDAFLSVPEASVPGDRLVSTAIALSFARAPSVAGGGTAAQETIVSYQIAMHTLFSIDLARRIKIEVDLPGTLAQEVTGAEITDENGAVKDRSASSSNDIRAGARVEILKQNGAAPSAALALSVWMPSGDRDLLTGSGGVRYAPSLIAGAEYARFAWSATLGRRFQGARVEGAGSPGGEIFFGAAAVLRVGPLRVGPEVFGTTSADERAKAFSDSATAIELLLGARVAAGPFTISLAGGPGLMSGFGAPAYRLLAGVGYAIDIAAEQGDAGAARSAGGAAARQDKGGEAALANKPIAAPVPEKKVADPPAAPTGSGAPGDAAACPSPSGCPASVRIEGTQIVITQQVRFNPGGAQIDVASAPLLKQIAGIMKDHPEIARVAVEGHTDNDGAERRNILLSQQRAVSVARWLIENGVDARRLETRGFGPRRPVADNGTEEGRAQNRRVELQILRRTTEGEAGWLDGPLP